MKLSRRSWSSGCEWLGQLSAQAGTTAGPVFWPRPRLWPGHGGARGRARERPWAVGRFCCFGPKWPQTQWNSSFVLFFQKLFDTYLMNFKWILMSNSAQFWSNDNFVQRKVQYYKVSGKIMMRIFMLSAAYLKLLFSLLNSNQRENLILKNGYIFSLL